MSGGANHAEWQTSFWRYFRLANKSWTPPKSIRVRQTRRGMTLRAAFIMPDGNIARTSVMLRKLRTGDYVIADEGLTIRLRLRARGQS